MVFLMLFVCYFSDKIRRIATSAVSDEESDDDDDNTYVDNSAERERTTRKEQSYYNVRFLSTVAKENSFDCVMLN